jgi:hypothetical protein
MLQFALLLTQWTRENQNSNKSVSELLILLEALLPDSHQLPPTFYALRQFLRLSLKTGLDEKSNKIVDICRNHHCCHLFPEQGRPDDLCPKCQTARYQCDPLRTFPVPPAWNMMTMPDL